MSAPSPTIGQLILDQSRQTQQRVEELSELLTQSTGPDPVEALTGALLAIAEAVTAQTQTIELLRRQIEELDARISGT